MVSRTWRKVWEATREGVGSSSREMSVAPSTFPFGNSIVYSMQPVQESTLLTAMPLQWRSHIFLSMPPTATKKNAITNYSRNSAKSPDDQTYIHTSICDRHIGISRRNYVFFRNRQTLLTVKFIITFVPSSRITVEVPLLPGFPSTYFLDTGHRWWASMACFCLQNCVRGRGMTYSPVVFVRHVVSISVVAEMVEWIDAVAFHC